LPRGTLAAGESNIGGDQSALSIALQFKAEFVAIDRPLSHGTAGKSLDVHEGALATWWGDEAKAALIVEVLQQGLNPHLPFRNLDC
jgi:hypothetical protein